MNALNGPLLSVDTPTGSMWAAIAAIVAAGLGALAGVYGAWQAKRTQAKSIDVELVKLMQSEVKALGDRVKELRGELVATQDESDEMRRHNRKLALTVADMEYRITRMAQIMRAARMTIPDDVWPLPATDYTPH